MFQYLSNKEFSWGNEQNGSQKTPGNMILVFLSAGHDTVSLFSQEKYLHLKALMV